ncbi:Lon protease family protein [Zoogloea ramigera]|uniref:Lon protease family protein n=1 Tax=Zoogloea ramigera TaxID=350 RepID=UPI003FA30255
MPTPLPPEQLYAVCDPSTLGFSSTDELPELDSALIHPRAVGAMHLGLDIPHEGYNLFVLGETGSGRHAIIHQLLEAERRHGTPPADWCYVNDFSHTTRPKLLRLPGGRGARLRDDMQHFVEELIPAISAVFESDEYRSRIDAMQEEEKHREEAALHELGHAAAELEVAFLRTPHGFAFVPMKSAEATMSQDEFEQLPEERQLALTGHIKAMHERLHKLMNDFPRWRRDMQNRIKEAGSEALRATVTHLVDDLKPAYADLQAGGAYLDAALQDIIESGESLRESSRSEDDSETTTYSGSIAVQRYLVNLLVENPADGGRAVVYEDHPTLQNLVGRIEHVVHMGTLLSNFTLIRAGALHRANGGFLVLDAVKVLSQPYAWEGLKRCLRAGEVRIESLSDLIGLTSTVQIEPEPMALELKVVLIGERLVYYLLSQYDAEFPALFKINADMESEIPRSAENTTHYARLIATLARRDSLPPLSAAAVARIIEHASRLASDAQRLSTRTQALDDLLHEASHFAATSAAPRVEVEHVETALAAHRQRNERLRERYRDEILRGTLLVDTAGSHVGQVNGLAVIQLGDSSFAHPVRITATARVGDGEVIDIEREVKLGGPIHSKGVLILSSFVASRFGAKAPLSLRASLVFEQSYGGVEGDSASLAELAALLSAIAGVPLHQSVAVSGSVNQFGAVQAVGGINEKIEGFFDICVARGLSGEQGVLIPAANVADLMLRREVVDAARAGQFHIWAVSDVDEALELLTGLTAGKADEKGEMPAGTFNARVAEGLARLAKMRRDFAATPKHTDHKPKGS